jgi:hypothetical protein
VTTGLRSVLLISRSKVSRRRQNRAFGSNRFEQSDFAGANVHSVGKIEANEKMVASHGYPGERATVTYGEQVY